jgi:cytochrome c biogenesis protein CcmG/thiol:disulfide interchange protein DsbE
MNTIRSSSLVLALALAASVSACAKKSADQATPAAPAGRGEVGSVAPEFTLPDLEGNQVALSSLKGKVVILDFWATWCPPCKEEVPHFVNLQSKYRAQGLEVVGLSLDAGGAKDVRPFADEHDVNYTMLIANEDVAKAYGNVTMIPTTFVLDRNGKIVQRFIGATSREVFEQTIRPLLAAS